PGHELAGVVVAVGRDVTRWASGDRVTVPFVGGCGTCGPCLSGDQQICDDQFQPGFTHWGSFAEFVSIHRADLNLVRLPESMAFDAAASLGCRFVTSFRAIVDQSRVRGGEWVAIHGCGGVGLSAVMIASAKGARVVAVDVAEEPLALAQSVGATVTLDARTVDDVGDAIREITGGGAHVSMDALGHTATCVASIASLRKRGRHLQVGLMMDEHAAPPIPMGRVIADELEILGSHGMQAHRYDALFAMIESGRLDPERLVSRTLSLGQAPEALMTMDTAPATGVTVIAPFSKSSEA
ncbi:MAG: zinc-dependent alcohol dehydrogenase family protein, partial [Bacteroidota bacterium]